MALLDPINALADAAPGFVWRLQTEDGNATSIRAFPKDAPGGDLGRMIVNMSVWETREALAEFVYRSAHMEVMRRRREWFQRAADAYQALWWVPAGNLPTVADAEERVAALRRHGPTPFAFTFRDHFPAPQLGEAGLRDERWGCPTG